MTLRERLQDDTTAAMRSGDALRRDVLRMAQNAIYNIEKAKQDQLSDDEVLGVLTREVKTRRESVEAFRAGGREDLATKEEAEIAILRDYLPEALTEDELSALVDEARRGDRRLRAPATWARSWAGSPRRPAAAPTARSSSGLVAQALARADLAASRHGALSRPSRDARSPPPCSSASAEPASTEFTRT